ncbi:unnamed protein product [Rotaria magnacalcarata]
MFRYRYVTDVFLESSSRPATASRGVAAASKPDSKTKASTAAEIRDNYKKANPDDSVLVYKFAAPGGCGNYHGTLLSHVKLDDGEWLKVIKLQKSNGSNLNEDEIRTKALPFIYDTKDEKESEKRRDRLKNSLRDVFPDHHVSIHIFSGAWSRSSSRVRIGHDAILSDKQCLTDPQFVTIGDHVRFNMGVCIQCHTFEQRVFKVAPVIIHHSSVLMSASLVFPGSTLDGRNRLLPLTLVLKNDRLLYNTHCSGVLAQQLQ